MGKQKSYYEQTQSRVHKHPKAKKSHIHYMGKPAAVISSLKMNINSFLILTIYLVKEL